MKILKIIHGYPPNYNAGSEVYSQSICDELSKRNEVTVFTREENDYLPDFSFREEKRDNKLFIYVNMARAKDGYDHHLLNYRFRQLVEKVKPDIAHIGHLNHLSIGIVDVLYELKVPIVYTLHDFWLMCPRGQFLQRNFDGKENNVLCNKQENSNCAKMCYSMYFSHFSMTFDKSLYYELSHRIPSGRDAIYDIDYWSKWIDARMFEIKRICKKIDFFIAPSKSLMNCFIDDYGFPHEKVKYLDYGFPAHYLKPVNPESRETFTFGYIGTHIPAKGINLLIDAFKMLKGKSELKIFGREQGQNTIALKNMTSDSVNQIEFCGEYINQNLATTVFNKIDCIVVPSIWRENSPLVIHEAQACKIPVITADFGGMKEYVQHNVNGLLFKHRNVLDLAEQMQFAYDNPEKMRTLGKRGYLYSQDGSVPDIETHCKELVNIYEQIIKSKHEKQVMAYHS